MRKLQCCLRIITCYSYLWVATRLSLSTGFSPTTSYSVHHSVSSSNMSRSTGSNVYRSVASLRGGGSLPLMQARHDHKNPSSSLDTSSASVSDSDSEIPYQRRGMGIALAAAYFTVMGAKCALPSVLAMLTSPDTGLTFAAGWNMSPQQLVARQLTLSTLAIALGKVLLGPVIDHFGGVLSLQVALSTLAVLLGIIAASQPFMLFAVCWVMVDFIFSSCWAASINAIHQSFPAEEWSRQIASLAAAARAGNAIAFSLFASVLLFFDPRMRQSWRPVFVVAAVSQIIPLFLLSKFGKPLLQKQQQQRQQSSSSYAAAVVAVRKKSSMRSSIATLRREASTPEFWLHLASRSTLMVFASFLLFVPTLMSQVYGASPAFAAQSGSIYALGCLLSITTISQVYSKLSRKSKIGSIVALLGTATISSLAQLGHVAGIWHLSATASAAFLFLWGFAFSVPFYIPPSLYALSRGGTESSATIADVFDIGGFTLLAAFNGYVAGIAHATPAAWIPTFQITTGCSVIALIALSLAIRLE